MIKRLDLKQHPITSVKRRRDDMKMRELITKILGNKRDLKCTLKMDWIEGKIQFTRGNFSSAFGS